MPIVASGSIERAQAMNDRWPAGSLPNVASPTTRPSSSMARRERRLVGVDTDRRHRLSSVSREMNADRMGNSALRETRSYKATSGPLDHEGGGTCSYSHAHGRLVSGEPPASSVEPSH